ncbi:glucose-1-phosphate thymidylyltransferase [Candidatus Bathyarchaeota archaeon]|nr:MAG: glucose-1-phosphate thymidylyltransferase [Candidatus Bathyarchaeota archaeon]
MKSVVLAAGEGVRLRPLTLTKPKQLLPVGNLPLLQHLLNSIKKAGIKEVLIVVGYLGEKIQSYFGDGSRLGLKLTYVWQKEVGGTGEALSLTSDYVEKSFLVVYGDLYVKPSVITKVVKAYKKVKENVLAVVEVERPENYGVVSLDEEGFLKTIQEKPEKPVSNLVNAGIYVFTEEIFEKIRQTKKSVRGEIELTDAVQGLVENKSKVYTVKLKNKEWLDVGKPWDLLEANQRFLQDLKKSTVRGKVERNVTIKGPVKIGVNVTVKSGTFIEGPVIVDEGSILGPNCYLRPYTSLGKDVKIGSGCEIKNSIVMNGTKIPHLSYVGDSIIGENCNFGAGTLVGNVRLDRKNIKTTIKGEVIDTGRRKFGVVVGDNVQTGINVSLMPGVKIGANTHVGPGLVVYKDIPANTKVFLRQTVKFEEMD